MVAAMVASASGCGNAKRDFRVERLDPLIEQVGAQRSTLAQTLRLTRPRRRRDAAVLRSQLAPIENTMRRIAALDPPDGTDAQFSRYVRANAALSAALRRFIDAYANGTAAQRRAAARRVGTANTRTEDAQTALRQALQ